jgi:hypothetical protein
MTDARTAAQRTQRRMTTATRAPSPAEGVVTGAAGKASAAVQVTDSPSSASP